MRRVPLFIRVLPFYAAVLLLLATPFIQRHIAVVRAEASAQAAQQALQAAVTHHKVTIEDVPTRIVIPTVGIDLPVAMGTYDFASKNWTVTNTTANYAENTAKINDEKGRSLIYGHWTRQVFGPTKNLAKGDPVYVYTLHNHIFKYTFEDFQIVKPSEVGVFDSFSQQKGLALMTCTGLYAQERRLMYFNLVQVT